MAKKPDPSVVLKEQGRRVKEKLTSLSLRMHPDKYRLVPARCGIDFVGFVVHADGRVRVRTATVRRFQKRFHAMRCEVRHWQRSAASVTTSVRAWIAHVKHAQSVSLRRAVFSR